MKYEPMHPCKDLALTEQEFLFIPGKTGIKEASNNLHQFHSTNTYIFNNTNFQ